MKKHELLKHAYDNYPKGCIARFKSAPNVDHISNGTFRIEKDMDNGVSVMSGDSCFYASKDATTGELIDEWAEIVEKKEPLFTTIDGVGLNEGSECHWVTPVSRGGFKYNYRCNFTKGHLGLFKKHPNYYHLFSTKEAAEAWIECANENLQNYQLERLTDKKGYIFVVNNKGTLITYIAKDKQEAEGFSDLWKGFNYTINEITLPKEQ